MIKIFIGDIGSSKTLSLVKDLYTKHFLKGNHIYTNISLNFGNKKQITYLTKEFFKDFTNQSKQLENACVVVDEAHVFMDSRRSMSQRNIAFSKFITQSRKKNVDLYLTSQDKSPYHFLKSGQIELRVRKLIDHIIFCKTYAKINNRWYKNYNDPIKKGTTLFCHNILYDKYLEPIGQHIYKGNKYFKLYNTNEIIDIL